MGCCGWTAPTPLMALSQVLTVVLAALTLASLLMWRLIKLMPLSSSPTSSLAQLDPPLLDLFWFERWRLLASSDLFCAVAARCLCRSLGFGTCMFFFSLFATGNPSG